MGRLSPLRGDLLFFARAKKRRQKKARPDVRAGAIAPVPGRSAVLGAGTYGTSLSHKSLSRPSWPLTPARGAASGASIGAPESKAEATATLTPNPSPASGRGEKGGGLSETPRLSLLPLAGEGARRADEGKLLLWLLMWGPLCVAPRRTAASGLSGADCLSGAAASFSDGRRGEHRRGPLRSSGAEARGVLSFAYFSLHKQRKVGRLTRRKASHAKQVTQARCNSPRTSAARPRAAPAAPHPGASHA